jgi:hypothetical protein
MHLIVTYMHAVEHMILHVIYEYYYFQQTK